MNITDRLFQLKIAIVRNDKRKQEIILKQLANRQEMQMALEVVNHTIQSYNDILQPWKKVKELLERGK